MKIYKILTVLLVSAFLYSCSNNNQQSNEQKKPATLVESVINKIIQPLSNYQAPAHRKSVEASEGAVYSTEKGTVVMVPQNAFVKEDGTVYQGQVQIEMKEVFGTAAIILSGIPMNVKDEKGETKPFISDGMFDISATGNGQKLNIAEGKAISIATPSDKAGKDFDLWKFDEARGEWQNIGDREKVCKPDEIVKEAERVNSVMAANLKPETGSRKTQKQKLVTSISHQQPLDAAEAPFLFNLRADYDSYPELETFKNVMWSPVEKLSEDRQKIFAEDIAKAGANIRLELKDETSMVYALKYGNKTIDMRPAFSGSDLQQAKAMFAEKMKVYNEELKQSDAINEARKESYNVYATKAYTLFKVVSTGMYNCDRYYNSNLVKSGFRVMKDDAIVLNNIYAILNENQGTICLSAAYLKARRYSLPSKDIKGFVHVLSDGSAYAVSNDPANSEEEIDLNLRPSAQKISTEEDLKKVISSL